MGEQSIIQMKKVELHCHLDGSLSPEWICGRMGREVPLSQLQVSPACSGLPEYLEKFDLPLSLLQDEEGLRGAGRDFLETAAGDGVAYVEVRFAPLLCTQRGLSVSQVIRSVLEGLQRGKEEFGVAFNVLVCAMRHHGEEENLEMLRQARQFLGDGVCGADLAGDESRYPMGAFSGLFTQAKKLGFPFTLHAGECGSAQNIADAFALGARRVGHGIAMVGRPDLQRECKRLGVGVEMCPISNLQTKAVASPEDYPLREFLDNGLMVTVNTDNRTVSGTSLSQELEWVRRVCGVTWEECLTMMKNAVAVSFTDEETKGRLYQMLAVEPGGEKNETV